MVDMYFYTALMLAGCTGLRTDIYVVRRGNRAYVPLDFKMASLADYCRQTYSAVVVANDPIG